MKLTDEQRAVLALNAVESLERRYLDAFNQEGYEIRFITKRGRLIAVTYEDGRDNPVGAEDVILALYGVYPWLSN